MHTNVSITKTFDGCCLQYVMSGAFGKMSSVKPLLKVQNEKQSLLFNLLMPVYINKFHGS